MKQWYKRVKRLFHSTNKAAKSHEGWRPAPAVSKLEIATADPGHPAATFQPTCMFEQGHEGSESPVASEERVLQIPDATGISEPRLELGSFSNSGNRPQEETRSTPPGSRSNVASQLSNDSELHCQEAGIGREPVEPAEPNTPKAESATEFPSSFFTPRLSPGAASESSLSLSGSPARTLPACQENAAQRTAPSRQQASPTQDWRVSSLYSSINPIPEGQDCSTSTARTKLDVVQLSMVLPLSMARSDWYLQDFQIISSVQKSPKLKIYHAVCVASGVQVNLKAYHKNRMDESKLKVLRERAYVLSRLEHESILKFYGALEDIHNIYFLHEQSHPAPIESISTLPESQAAAEFLRPLLDAFCYLVSEGIRLGLPCQHNIVVAGGNKVKYAEFLSAWDECMHSMCDTDWWSAIAPPERCQRLPTGVENVQNRVERVLSWAAGTLAVRLLVGELPTSAEGGEQPATSFPGDGLYDVHVQQRILNSLSPAASRFVQAALDLNPENRATVLTLRQQPFIWQPSDSSACVDHESGRASMDSWGDSSFGVPRGPSLEASCYSATRTSLAERRGLSVEGYTQPPPGPTAGGWQTASSVLRKSVSEQSGARSESSKKTQRPISPSPLATCTGRQSPSQTLATAAGEMDGNGLFYFSRGGSATARRSSLSDQHLDGKPLRTPRQEMRRKMTESVALQHQAKSPVPHSVDRLLQAVQFD
eukprot:CAMPEP_0117661586 /NCGR_PEP_ID=MMETSP0804-20121206/7615_1 /TAXON_ID=1074897 /ORGANISM="Tetraselmis astigmatica, Strain CCMP880" /LENGTH=708 /DNA_ID=CAMNT_0005468461 /DNA_START=130 /DNA_END=2256 /DNA_ORIENTATION=+